MFAFAKTITTIQIKLPLNKEVYTQTMLMGYPFLAAMGHPLFTNWTVVCTLAIHITGLLALYLLHALTPVSVAAMVVCSEALLISFRIWGIKRFQLFKEQK